MGMMMVMVTTTTNGKDNNHDNNNDNKGKQKYLLLFVLFSHKHRPLQNLKVVPQGEPYPVVGLNEGLVLIFYISNLILKKLFERVSIIGTIGLFCVPD